MLNHHRRFALVFAMLLLLLSGCTPSENQTPTIAPSLEETLPSTEPTVIVTEDPTVVPTEPSEPLPDAELFTEDGLLPLLIGVYPVDFVGENASEEKPSSITINYTAWDLEAGELVSPVPWYRQGIDSWLETNIRFWAGSTHMIGAGYREPLVQGVTQRTASLGNDYWGTVVIATSLPGYARLYWIKPDGSTQELTYPKAPEDLCREGYRLHEDPVFAWTDGVSVFVLYLAANQSHSESDFICTTYPIDAPDSAQWITGPATHFSSNVYLDGNFAYHRGKLYVGSLKRIVVLDTASGEIQVLDETNLFRDVFQIYPNSRWHDSSSECQMYVVGCWNDTLIFETTLWTDEEEGEKYHVFYVAVKDGQIQGVMERSEWGLFTFYDQNLQVLGTDARYQLTLEPYCVKFPLEG